MGNTEGDHQVKILFNPHPQVYLPVRYNGFRFSLSSIGCDRIWENQPVSEIINYRISVDCSCSSKKTLMEIKKKKGILLEDEASDWLQIWTTASDVKGNKAIKQIFLLNINSSSQVSLCTCSVSGQNGQHSDTSATKRKTALSQSSP